MRRSVELSSLMHFVKTFQWISPVTSRGVYLRIIYNDKQSTFEESLNKNESVTSLRVIRN